MTAPAVEAGPSTPAEGWICDLGITHLSFRRERASRSSSASFRRLARTSREADTLPLVVDGQLAHLAPRFAVLPYSAEAVGAPVLAAHAVMDED
jgi:hypothetical protein